MWLKDVKLARWGMFSLDDMIALIAEENSIKELTFVVYQNSEIADPTGYRDINPQEGVLKYEKVCVPGLRKELKKLRREASQKDYLVGITSKVNMEGGNEEIPAHLCFLDFCVGVEDEDVLKEIKDFVVDQGIAPGFIAESGRSYHFYSSTLVSPQRWKEILEDGESSWIVDADWAALQQRREHSVLRVSQNSKKPFFPAPVEALGYQMVNPAQQYLFPEYSLRWPLERIL